MMEHVELALTKRVVEALHESRLSLSIGLIVILGMLYWQGLTNKAGKLDVKFTSIRRAPFNVPLIGHIWAFIWDLDGFLRSNRDTSPHGIFSLSMFGINTNIIHSPSLMRQFFAQPNSVIEHKTLGANISTKIFGFPKSEVPNLITHFDELMNTITKHLMKEPGLENFWKTLKEDIEVQVPDILSFSNDSSKQYPWERLSNTISNPDGSVETSLFPMVRNCVGSMSSRVLMGSDLYDSHPDLLQDVWQVDSNIMGFIFGFPSFLPPMSRAYSARNRLLQKMTEWHRGMEEESLELPRFEDVSDLMKARQQVYSARGFSNVGKAAIDMSILWALNANSNSVVYWLLRNIHANDLLRRVRTEITPFVTKENNRVKINVDGLMNASPLLKSCYWETLRIDSGPWSFKRLQKDCTLVEAASDARTTAPSSPPSLSSSDDSTFSLHQSDCVLIPADLHHTDPRYFKAPNQFIPERFITHTEGGTDVSEIQTIRPYGGGATMCKGRMLAEKEVLAFVAAVLVCWELEPVGEAGWSFQGRVKTSGVTSPKGDLRVRMRRREW